MPDWSYYWGSNAMRGRYGLFLSVAARLGETGSHTPPRPSPTPRTSCILPRPERPEHALPDQHGSPGGRALVLSVLPRLARSLGERLVPRPLHRQAAAIIEPAYPYFAGSDNHGISDDKVSLLGPAPGFVPGGPNASYSGDAVPPGGEVFLNRFYRDWNDQTVWTVLTWEITENSIKYQGPYVALAAAFVPPAGEIFSDGFESGDTSAWSATIGGIWRPAPGTSWQWQLQGTIDTTIDVEMYDIDLFDTPVATIADLKADGRIVVCYLSAGSWEDWRPDAADYPAVVLGNPLSGWPGERWVDIRRLDLLGPILDARLDLARDKGCTGVEPDNVDAYQNSSGFPLDAADQLVFNRWLATHAHARGLSIGLKNDLDQVAALEPDFDWALNEQCYEYDECDALQPFIDAGKAVFGVEYSGDEYVFCPYFNALGYSWLKKDSTSASGGSTVTTFADGCHVHIC